MARKTSNAAGTSTGSARGNTRGDTPGKATAAVIEALTVSYNLEIETVMNYIAASNNLDGALAAPIKAALAADVPAELGHAQILAKRIKTLGGSVPGSLALDWTQKSLQPPRDTTDLLAVVDGVIDAERGAIKQYEKIIEMCASGDQPTQDLASENLADEQEHLREFLGFRKELEKILR